MKQIGAYFFYNSSNRELVKLTIKKALDATSCNSLDTLLNSNLLYEAGVFAYDVPWKFRGKQYIDKNGIKILLSYLLYKGKIFLEPVLDISDKIVKSIEIICTGLSETVEECLALNRVSV